MKALLIPTLLATAISASTSSCSGTRNVDPNEVETMDAEYGSTDMQAYATDMAEGLLNSANLEYVDTAGRGNDNRVVAIFGGIANETSEHINTAQVLRRMQEDLSNSGKFRLLPGAEANGQDLIAEQVNFQQNSGRVRADMAKAFGNQLGADVVIYGALSDIRKESGRSLENLGTKTKRNYFQLYMAATNVETGEILWSNTKDISKEQRISLFGRG